MRSLSRTLVAVAVLAGALSFTPAPQAVAVTSHKPLNDTRPVGAAPVEVDFPIEFFGVVADLPTRASHLPEHGRTPYGEARFRVDGRWTAWQALGKDGAQAAGQFASALLDVDRADAYQVRGLPTAARNWRAAAINSTDGPTVIVGHRRADAAVAAPRCMSRADWGADESISGWAKGQKQTFAPVQVLTVHHTAGSNDHTQDYAATVRGIYSYHVQTRKWADIGYQYLVDAHGVVYEGRSSGHTSKSCLGGGDGSDFGHQTSTDYGVTGAHVGNYNTGNLGISVLGCFEPTTACKGDKQPTAAAVDAVEAELALLAERHSLDPEGSVHYVNATRIKDVPTITGHRDWASTECPGANLYGQLAAIRSNVADRMAGSLPMDSALVSFRTAGTTVAENVGTVQVVVVRSGNTDQPSSVRYARTSGTATPGSDFILDSGTLSFAAGETQKTVPVTITNDSTREAAETVTVTLSSPSAGTAIGTRSTRLTIAASDQRPDGLISTAATSGYVGNNVYNGTGAGQTKTLKGKRKQTRSFYVRISNDGNVTNAFKVTGTGPRSGSTVRYFSGSTDVTKAMRSSAGWTVRLKPGARKSLTVKIGIGRTAAYGSQKLAKVRATWTGDGTRSDVVKAVVKVVR